MTPIITITPKYPIFLADLLLYVMVMKDRRPEIAQQATRAIEEGRYYEQN